MDRAMAENSQDDNFISISTVLDELERDLLHQQVEPKIKKTHPNREIILKVLSKAADDHRFLARLAEDPTKVLKEYDLNQEERAALASGDLRRIESWVGKLDKRLSTWIWCRLQQEKW
jgi:rRNA maturation endonuclease Nob1